MKKIFLFIASASILSLANCGNNKTEETANVNVPEGMVAADLSAQGLAALVNVPDSTTGQLEVTQNPQGGVDVKVGKNFQLTIIESPGNFELKKKDITTDEVHKFVKYVVEEPNALVWEWQMEGAEPEYHFYTIVTVGSKTYEIYDVLGEVFSEDAAMDMLDAAKSIRVKEIKPGA